MKTKSELLAHITNCEDSYLALKRNELEPGQLPKEGDALHSKLAPRLPRVSLALHPA